MYLICSRRSSDTKERDTLSRVPLFGMPDWSRTSGLQSRSLTLYPTELRAHILLFPSIAVLLVLLLAFKSALIV